MHQSPLLLQARPLLMTLLLQPVLRLPLLH
jgi:hypothetical protein